jgi:hypothetical protein
MNAHVFTQAYKNANNQVEVGIHSHYSEFFEFQWQTYKHLQF